MNKKICVVYTHQKLGDLIWQLPYIKAISDHHNEKIDLIVRKKTQAQNILKDTKYINNVFYNDFRKGIYYWFDVFKLMKIYFQNRYDYVYLLDKVNKPAIAAKLTGIKNIIGPGIGNQKKWLTVNNYLTDEDWKMNYSEQSKKLLKINSISVSEFFPKLDLNTERFEKENPDITVKGKKIAFGVDSFENFKMWFEEDFVELADLLYKKKIFDYIYLICGPEKSFVAEKIISTSKQNYFINCSNKDLQGITLAIKNSDFFVGNNSGPLNLAAALNVKSFGLIANDPISELKYSKINPITPDDYIDNKWNRDREGMKKLRPDKVFNYIIQNLK
jgi:heptosyltransferase II